MGFPHGLQCGDRNLVSWPQGIIEMKRALRAKFAYTLYQRINFMVDESPTYHMVCRRGHNSWS